MSISVLRQQLEKFVDSSDIDLIEDLFKREIERIIYEKADSLIRIVHIKVIQGSVNWSYKINSKKCNLIVNPPDCLTNNYKIVLEKFELVYCYGTKNFEKRTYQFPSFEKSITIVIQEGIRK